MYPILVVGLVCLGTSAFYAARGDGRVRGSIEALSRALSWFIATAVATSLNHGVLLPVERQGAPARDDDAHLLPGPRASR